MKKVKTLVSFNSSHSIFLSKENYQIKIMKDTVLKHPPDDLELDLHHRAVISYHLWISSYVTQNVTSGQLTRSWQSNEPEAQKSHHSVSFYWMKLPVIGINYTGKYFKIFKWSIFYPNVNIDIFIWSITLSNTILHCWVNIRYNFPVNN